ncbi:hypothetical protein OSTOST_02046 [Ostertagia ostertagi]
MVELVVRTVGELNQPRVAAVAMSCPSEILLQMNIYTPSQLRKDLLAYHPAGGEIATAQAYGLARDLLNRETTKDKSVVVFSNGQTSTCSIPLAGNEDERSTANKLHNNNTGIIYLPIEKPVNRSYLDEITHDPNNVADPQNLTTKQDPARLEKAKDWLVQRLNGTSATTTEAWETTKEKHGTTPTAADRTTESQAETQRTGVRELSTIAEMPQLEATTTTEGANLSVSPVHTPSPPDDVRSSSAYYYYYFTWFTERKRTL